MSSSPEAFLPRVPLDGDLTDQRFDQLVGARSGIPAASVESDPVDYKLSVSLDGVVELAKDVAAFANTGGGYLLLGVGQTGGQPQVLGLDEAKASVLGDPTQLYQKLSAFLLPTPGILCRRVPRPDAVRHSVIIFVEPFDSIPVLFFREGRDVHAHALYVRVGAASQPATKEDWQRILENVVERQRVRWTRQVDSFVQLARELAAKPPSRLPIEVADTAFNRLRARVSDVATRATALIGQMVSAQPQDDTAGLQTEFIASVDDLIAAGTDQIRFPSPDGLRLVVEALEQVLNAHPIAQHNDAPSLFAGEIALPRLFALGAMSTRQHELWAVPLLVRRSIDDYAKKYYIYWHRYLMTMLYRAHRMRQDAIQLASDYLAQAEDWMDEGVRWNALSQFDYLRCAISELDHPGSSPLPNFATLYRSRVEPLVRTLVADPGTRQQALGEVTDEELADVLWRLEDLAAEYARSEARNAIDYVADDWSDTVVRRFFEQHPRKEPRLN